MKSSYITPVRLLLLAIFTMTVINVKAQNTQVELYNGTIYDGYIYVQRPGTNMEFVDVKADTIVTIGWGEIAIIRKEQRAAWINEGLDDEVTLSSGETIKGQIVEQIPGVSITIADSANVRRTIAADKIKISRKVGVNKKLSTYKQRTYNNTIILCNGAHKDGLIVEQHVGEKAEDNYLVLVTELGYKEKILFEDVSSYCFKPIKNIQQ